MKWWLGIFFIILLSCEKPVPNQAIIINFSIQDSLTGYPLSFTRVTLIATDTISEYITDEYGKLKINAKNLPRGTALHFNWKHQKTLISNRNKPIIIPDKLPHGFEGQILVKVNTRQGFEMGSGLLKQLVISVNPAYNRLNNLAWDVWGPGLRDDAKIHGFQTSGAPDIYCYLYENNQFLYQIPIKEDAYYYSYVPKYAITLNRQNTYKLLVLDSDYGYSKDDTIMDFNFKVRDLSPYEPLTTLFSPNGIVQCSFDWQP